MWRVQEEQVLRTNQINRIETFVQVGNERHAIISIRYPIFDNTNQLVAIGGIAMDITENKRAETILRASEARYQTITRLTADCAFSLFLRTDGTVELEWLVGELVHQLNYSPEELEHPAFLMQAIHPDDQPTVWHIINRLKEGHEVVEECRILTRYGGIRWLHITALPEWDEEYGHYGRIIGAIQDITTRKQAELHLWREYTQLERMMQQRSLALSATSNALHAEQKQRKLSEQGLRQSQAQLRALLEHAPLAIFIKDLQSRYTLVNYHASILAGYNERDMLGKDDTALLPPEQVREVLAHDREVLATGNVVTREQTFSDGVTERTYITIKFPIYDEQGQIEAIGGVATDITLRKTTEERLYRLAMYDDLTGLPNRNYLLSYLSMLALHSQSQSNALLSLDIDNFKLINDNLGQFLGDHLLSEVGQRLRHMTPSNTVVARFGGDEFVLLLPNTNLEEAVQLATRLLVDLRHPLLLDSQEVYINVSIGVAMNDRQSNDPTDLLHNANMAMFEAKARGRSQVVIYDEMLRHRARERLEVESELPQAIANGELYLLYQPIIDLTTSHLVGFEALVRWYHPQRGLLKPGRFIPIAEESHLITVLDRWVMLQACEQAAQWQALLPPNQPFTLRVNISARELLHAGLVDRVAAILHTTNLSPHHLHIEITETAAIHNIEMTAAILHDLSAMGVHVSLDDFGTGYSSLSYLQLLPVHTVKIDASFVHAIPHNQQSAAIVQTIITLAHTLGIEVIAEGVENETQYSLLRSMQCRYGQGFWLAPLLKADEAGNLLLNGLLPKHRQNIDE
ncbi:MAG: EAL domain-containing protein [Chloroflexaceae bacterium]|nr:EAL domain-containing protein [Chloroflexaceae bacterium]